MFYSMMYWLLLLITSLSDYPTSDSRRDIEDVRCKCHSHTFSRFIYVVMIIKFQFSFRVKYKEQKFLLRVPPLSFSTFLEIDNGRSDRAEIFTTDRARKITRHVFEEEIFFKNFLDFFLKLWFSIGSHLATGRPHQNFSDWAEIFFVDTYDYISDVILSFFENLTFFFFYNKNT